MVSAVQSSLVQAQLAPAALGSQISTAIAAKSLDAQKQEGAAVLQLLDNAAKIAAPGSDGLGTLIDVHA